MSTSGKNVWWLILIVNCYDTSNRLTISFAKKRAYNYWLMQIHGFLFPWDKWDCIEENSITSTNLMRKEKKVSFNMKGKTRLPRCTSQGKVRSLYCQFKSVLQFGKDIILHFNLYPVRDGNFRHGQKWSIQCQSGLTHSFNPHDSRVLKEWMGGF